MKNFKYVIAVFVLVAFACGFFAMLPPIRERIVWRLDLIKDRITYAFFPPEEELFVPQGEVAAVVQATLDAAAEQVVTPTATLEPTIITPDASPTPGPTATPLPEFVLIEGGRYEHQHGLWNYCAPATLAMGLSYWDWEGTRLDTGQYLKPFDEDLNVMPYEMEGYVTEQTNLSALYRYGGDLTLLKTMVAGGFPVLIEKGAMIKETNTGQVTWMGHYNLVVGYDDAAQEIIVRDSYYSPPDYPLDFRIPYAQLEEEWRGFNYVFLIIYPPDKQNDVYNLLGEYGDSDRANQIASEIASAEIAALNGPQKFFAWYNYGTSLVQKFDYGGAAQAYDQAFNYLASLPVEEVPKKVMRMVWYQTGPYYAYYYTARYQDVINLANEVLAMPTQGPYLEESLYWRARAQVALGDNASAIDDLRRSLDVHPNFAPSVALMQELGVAP